LKHSICIVTIISVLSLFPCYRASAQAWDFIKEEDGIKIFTRKELEGSLKSYKGETTFRAPMEKVCMLLGTANNFDWWDKGFTTIKVLKYKDQQFIQYYFIYDMPWPVADRDLTVESVIKMDTATGKYTVSSHPSSKAFPQNPDLVRITKYWQTWTVQAMDKGYMHITLEGAIDPGGNIPSWVYNMLVTEMPLKTLRSLRQRSLSSRPANLR
jgi:hypothetical protein